MCANAGESRAGVGESLAEVGEALRRDGAVRGRESPPLIGLKNAGSVACPSLLESDFFAPSLLPSVSFSL